MATVHIDNQPYQVTAGDNLLQACLSLGFDIPYFCWHPALGAVGACRQCAIKHFKDEKDTRGRIEMACMTPVRDGMRLSLADDEVKDFHAQVIEWLMTNHPHDCPVCDEGGECHLQDMTVLSGHTYRRFRFLKRTFRNQYLGPFLTHEMNRCITCYRCVRFYNDYAGGNDLHAMASKNHVYFGRHQDGVLENEFSGNLAEVCPTGVFTDKTLMKHYTRKWDMQSAPSVCAHCGVGCNTLPGERYGLLRRIQNRYNHQVNGYFLCDRGRYGYGFVNSEQRVRRPLRHDRGESRTLSGGEALQHAADLVRGGRVLGIGSPRASLEANVMLRRLVGAERFHAGVAPGEWRCLQAILHALRQGPARTPSLHEMEQADAILILGEDLTQTAARTALALRQAVRQASFAQAATLKIPPWQDIAVRSTAGARSPLYIASPFPTRLDDVATETLRAPPAEIARLGFAVAHAIDSDAPAAGELSDDSAALAKRIAEQLAKAQRPLIVSGTGCADPTLIEAAANVAWALCRRGRPAALSYAMPECNSLGLALLEPRGLEQAMDEAAQAPVDTLIILENDLYRRALRLSIDAFLSSARQIVVLDHLVTPTAERAHLILPAATFAEGDGTLISSEGRAQRYFQVFVPEEGDVRESWRWLGEMASINDGRAAAPSLDQVLAEVAHDFPHLAPAVDAAPGAAFRAAGQRIPRQPVRYSGRTAMHADHTLHEPKPPTDDDSPLAFSMEGYNGKPPPALITRAWAPHWNSVQAYNKFQQEVGGPLRGGDPGIRLIEASAQAAVDYFHTVPPPAAGRNGEWQVVPRHHLFGSEELSLHAPAVAERVPAPYVAISPADAAALNVADGETVKLALYGDIQRLPAVRLPGLAPGVLALPRLPGVEIAGAPSQGRLDRIMP